MQTIHKPNLKPGTIVFLVVLTTLLSSCSSGSSGNNGTNNNPVNNDPYPLDTSFGTNGIVLTDFGNSPDQLTGLIELNDGNLLAYGRSINSTGLVPALARYLDDGALDTTLDADGKLIPDVNIDQNIVAAEQSDGKFLIAGILNILITDKVFVYRYNPDGTLDTDFSSDGKLELAFGSEFDYAAISSILVQSDGKIVVSGVNFSGLSGLSWHLVVIRINSDGTIDTTFGNNGEKRVALASTNDSLFFSDSVQQLDGKLLFYGGRLDNYANLFILRMLTNGSLDNTFGSGGIVNTPQVSLGVHSGSIRQLSDGKILASGMLADDGTGGKLALIRYLSTGALDSSFGQDGIATVPYQNGVNGCTGLIVQPNGKYIISATGFTTQNYDMLIARFQENGVLDNTFGDSGIMTIQSIYGNSQCSEIIAQNDKLMAGAYFQNMEDFALFRFSPEP